MEPPEAPPPNPHHPETHRWRLPSGIATMAFPSPLTAADIGIIRQYVDLLEKASEPAGPLWLLGCPDNVETATGLFESSGPDSANVCAGCGCMRAAHCPIGPDEIGPLLVAARGPGGP